MRLFLAITVLFCAFLPFPVSANCLGVAQGIVSQCLADTGDGKVTALYVQNQKCIRRRVSDISRAWRHFNEAVESLDTNRIQAEAANVRHQTQGRSKMFTSCWKTMRNSCNLIGDTVDNTIAAITAGTCK